MTAEYNEGDIRFIYPENWTLIKEEPTGDGLRTVAVHSPDGAFWSVSEGGLPADQLVSQIVDTLIQEYEDAETSDFERLIGTLKVRGVELNFYCLDFLVVAQVVYSIDDDRSRVFLCQAESRQFDAMSQVFDAMTLSLMGAIPDPSNN